MDWLDLMLRKTYFGKDKTIEYQIMSRLKNYCRVREVLLKNMVILGVNHKYYKYYRRRLLKVSENMKIVTGLLCELCKKHKNN